MSDFALPLFRIVGSGGVMEAAQLDRAILAGTVQCGSNPVSATTMVRLGDRLRIEGTEYDVVTAGPQRLQIVGIPHDRRVTGRVRVHCGLHKCLTIYTRNVYSRVAQTIRRMSLRRARPDDFRHFYHRLDAFLGAADRHTISSLSGHALDLGRFDDIRVARIVRDPRDLVVSGYYYHLRDAEHWCRLKAPTELDYMIVNGAVPDALRDGPSLTEYLNAASREDGLRAEIQFRRHHFASMLAWPEHDARVLLLRYEDILGNEPDAFARIAEHFGWGFIVRNRIRRLANAFRSGGSHVVKSHVRDPSAQQWRSHFGPELTKEFAREYGQLLARYGYPEG